MRARGGLAISRDDCLCTVLFASVDDRLLVEVTLTFTFFAWQFDSFVGCEYVRCAGVLCGIDRDCSEVECACGPDLWTE